MTLRRVAFGVIALAIACAAAWILYRIAQSITMAELVAAIRGTSSANIIGSQLATAASFAALGYYDRFATRIVAPGRIARGYSFWTGVVSHAISNTLGFHVVTGSALRYRLYRDAGLDTVDIARVTAIVGVCVGLGSIAMLAIALVFTPQSFAWGRAAGIACMIALLLVIACFPALIRMLRLRHVDLPALPRRALAKPLCVGLVEAAAAILAFYVLLPADLSPGFATVAAIFLAAVLLGVLSHAPGGVGVFEAAVLAAFPAGNHAGVLAALLLYRLLYNLVPFCLASIALAVRQVASRHAGAAAAGTSIRGRV